jgi:hypothetical protein
MKTVIARLSIAVVFAAAAWLCWSESALTGRVADARQDIFTLNHAGLAPLAPQATLSDYLPGDRKPLADEIRVGKSIVAYWLGRYDAVAADSGAGGVDPEILLASANAAFRLAQRDPAMGAAAAQRLDGVLQAYAAALKAAVSSSAVAREAAYNYEFVSRLRDRLARTPQGRIARSPLPSAPVMGGDLPAGATLHGGPGGPPPDTKMEELQTIMPMEYGDREAQPEPTPGAKRERKG